MQTGKTVFIEPTEVVEANNKVRELENEERKEIIRILREFAKQVRPYVHEILDSYHFLALIDFIRAKAELARMLKAIEPEVKSEPHIDLFVPFTHCCSLLWQRNNIQQSITINLM